MSAIVRDLLGWPTNKPLRQKGNSMVALKLPEASTALYTRYLKPLFLTGHQVGPPSIDPSMPVEAALQVAY